MPERGAAPAMSQDTAAVVLARLRGVAVGQVSLCGRVTPDLRQALQAAGFGLCPTPQAERPLQILLHCLEDASVCLPDLLVPGREVLVIEAQPWGSLHRLLRVLRPEAADAAQVVAALTGRGQAELRGLHRWEERFVFSGLPAFEAGLIAQGLTDAAALASCSAALVRAWREQIRPDPAGAALVQPMICWTLVGTDLPR